MGVVRKARQIQTAREDTEDDDVVTIVAIKRSFAEGHPDLEAAIWNEANLNFNMAHPNVLSLKYYGYHNGGYLVVMPLIDTDLEKVIELHNLVPDKNTPSELQNIPDFLLHYSSQNYTGPNRVLTIPDKFAAYFTYMLARTLDDLHRTNGIIHRDISLGNVLLDKKIGALYLTDFGVAKMKGDTNVVIVGKLPYMSRESLMEPLKVDQRSDIYSLGVMAYKMKTGFGPNDFFIYPDDVNVNDAESCMRNDVWTTINMFNREPVPLREIVKGTSNEFSQIIHKAVHTDPSKRYDTLDKFAYALEKFLHKGRGPVPRSVADYLKMHTEGISSFDHEEMYSAWDRLQFLSHQNWFDKLSGTLSGRKTPKGTPEVFQPLNLTRYARERLEEYKNPARK